MNTRSVEARLHRAGSRPCLSLLAGASEAPSDSAPPPPFWSGTGEVADTIEEDVAAVNAALSVDVKATNTKGVYVET